jgi:hypothetical protein
LSLRDTGKWIEPVQCYTQEYALSVAYLIHQDTRSVIKVVRYGLNIPSWSNAHAVELVEQQIARQREQTDKKD